MTSTFQLAARTVGGLALAGAGCVGYAALIERNLFTLREVSAPVLPPGSSPLRVLQVSEGSVRGHLQRSRKFLSTRLAPWRPSDGAPPGARETEPARDTTSIERGGPGEQ